MLAKFVPVLVLLLFCATMSCGKYDKAEVVTITGQVNGEVSAQLVQCVFQSGSWEKQARLADISTAARTYELKESLDLGESTSVSLTVMMEGYKQAKTSAPILDGRCELPEVSLEPIARHSRKTRELEEKPRALKTGRKSSSHTHAPEVDVERESATDLLRQKVKGGS